MSTAKRPSAPKAVNQVLEVKIIEGKYYCTCTNQETPQAYAAPVRLTKKSLEALEALGIQLPPKESQEQP